VYSLTAHHRPLRQCSGMSPERQRTIAWYRRGKQLPIAGCGRELRIVVRIVGRLVRVRLLRLPVLVLSVVALTGCGNDERALRLPAVKEALHEAGFGKLHVLTQQSGYEELRKKGFPGYEGSAPNGPDYLQDRARPALLVVRFGTVSDASRVVSKTRLERSGAISVLGTRICNVVVLNYAPEVGPARSSAGRVADELRRRCT
jgi:hypothetical protein